MLLLLEIVQIHFSNTISSNFRNPDAVVDHELR